MVLSRMVNTNRNRVIVWNHPSHPMIKVNVDGALKATSRESDVGVILRDSWGSSLGGEFFHLSRASTEEVEAKDVLEGVKLAKRHNLVDVVIESECKNVTD